MMARGYRRLNPLRNQPTQFTSRPLRSAQLEGLQKDQEVCKKSLSDFLDGKRRQFPRFYFTSEADLLDILSNGSMPEKIMKHVDKVFLATKQLELEEAPGVRPKATRFVSGVGHEIVDFQPVVPLEGKLEVYLQIVLDGQRAALRKTLERSMDRFGTQSRTVWLMNKFQNRPMDPAQVSILVAAIQHVKDVEAAMARVAKGARVNFYKFGT